MQSSINVIKATKVKSKSPSQPDSWVTSVANAVRRKQEATESKLKTVLTCRVVNRKNSLIVPADMTEFQPRSLRYLQNFAATNNLSLIEDRRKIKAQPIIEKRTRKDPMMILGMSMLLKQAGLPGPARSLSTPHRLNPENRFFTMSTLIDMAACSAKTAKHIVLAPNRITVKALNNDDQPISGYACNIRKSGTTTLLSHFESDNLRAIGYASGNQFVFHLCLGGGTLQTPSLWSELKTLESTDVRFQLFTGENADDDFGLLYSTLYFDLSQAPYPSWLSSKPAIKRELQQPDKVA